MEIYVAITHGVWLLKLYTLIFGMGISHMTKLYVKIISLLRIFQLAPFKCYFSGLDIF